jgi:hypothetical protein
MASNLPINCAAFTLSKVGACYLAMTAVKQCGILLLLA